MKQLASGVALCLAVSACAISTQQEVAMGTQYAQQINAQLPIVGDAEVNRYINVLGETIARVADNRNLDWHFYVVDSKEVNAFAVPGGFIYVNRGLVERTAKMNQLAGVLAHEIGHVVRRHSVQQMEAAQRANAGLTLACILTRVCENQVAGAAIQVGGTALFAKFGRDDERQADEVGIQYMVRAGIHPQGMPDMFRILIDERSRQRSSVEAWFATHPLEEDRLEDTQAIIAGIPANTLRPLAADTRAFQSFRQRLTGLPVVTRRTR